MNYIDYLIQIIRRILFQPFYENHVIGVLFLAVVLSFAILSIPSDNRKTLHNVLAVFTKLSWRLQYFDWGDSDCHFAFIVLFVRDLNARPEVQSMAWYLLCVLLANLIQAFVVLPIILKWRSVSPIRLFKAMYPALSAAFFTKSSSAALPIAIRVSQERAALVKKWPIFLFRFARRSIWMLCAAFIYITVLFVRWVRVWHTLLARCLSGSLSLQ